MERFLRRTSDMSDEQIASAASLLCGLDQQYSDPMPISNLLKMPEEIQRAQDVLKKSGKKRVRQLADGHYMEHLDPEFWAHDEEIRIARHILLQAIDTGYIPIGKFVEYGLDHHFSHSLILVRGSADLLPDLNFQAREKLFSSVTERVREELKTFGPDSLKGLTTLFPNGLMAKALAR